MRNGIESVLGKEIIKEIKRAHVVKSGNSLGSSGTVQTGSRSARGSRDLDTGWLQKNTKLSGNPSRAGEKVKEDTRNTAVIEICISGNTGGRQFKEESNSKKSTKKRGDTTQKTNQRNQAAWNCFLLSFWDGKNLHWNKILSGKKKRRNIFIHAQGLVNLTQIHVMTSSPTSKTEYWNWMMLQAQILSMRFKQNFILLGKCEFQSTNPQVKD